MEQQQHGGQQDRAKGIDVLERIQGQATHQHGRGIAAFPGHPAMSDLVHGDREEHRNRPDTDLPDNILDIVHAPTIPLL